MQLKIYREAIEHDYEMMSNIVLPVSLKKINEQKQKYMTKYLRYYVDHRLKQFSEKFKCKDVLPEN